MLRAVVSLTIVAAFHLEPALAQAISEDIPIPGGTVALARASGIESVPDRARFVAEILRVVYNEPPRQRAGAGSLFNRIQRHLEDVRVLRRGIAMLDERGGFSLAHAADPSMRAPLT